MIGSFVYCRWRSQPRPVHWVCEAALALAQIWTWQTDACQSSSPATFHSMRIKGISQRYLLPILQIQFANIDNLDFSDAQDKKPLQEFDVAVGREAEEYTLK
jgi:hypothetical protein